MTKWIQKQKKEPAASCSFQAGHAIPSALPEPPLIGMFSQAEFPPLHFPPPEEFEDPTKQHKHVPKVSKPTTVDAHGQMKSITAAEGVLNWHTETLLAQNKALGTINSRLINVQEDLHKHDSSTTQMLKDFQKRLSRLESGINTGYGFMEDPTPEIEKLRRQISLLQQHQVQTPVFHTDPFSLPRQPYQPPPLQNSPIFAAAVAADRQQRGSTNRRNPASLKKRIQETEKLRKGKAKASSSKGSSSEPDLDLLEDSPLTSPSHKQLMISNPLESFLQTMTITDSPAKNSPLPLSSSSHSSSVSTSFSSSEDEQDDDIPHSIYMADPPEEEMISEPEDMHPPSAPVPVISFATQFFTLDDLPYHKWPERVESFHSWLNVKNLTEESRYNILLEFVSKFTGSLKHWWHSISDQDQMAFLLLQDFDQAIQIVYQYFIGKPSDISESQRREYFERRCCSLQKKDLDRHYAEMAKLFYRLGADPNLKQVFLNSVPSELTHLVERNFLTRGQKIVDTPFGEIHQEIHLCLDDLCLRRQMMKNYLTDNRILDKACSKQYLKIKCPKGCDGSSCDRSFAKKKSHHRKFRNHPHQKRKWRFLRHKRSKPSREKRSSRTDKKSGRCFICRKKGHFARNCPRSSQHLLLRIQEESGLSLEDADLESLFSEDDELNEDTLCIIPDNGSSDDPDTVYNISSTPSPHSILPITHCPHFPVQILTSKFARPIHVIALIDTGAASSMIDTKVLPDEFWKPSVQYFNSASGDTFSTKVKSVPINIQFFPKCSIKASLVGSSLPNKDLIIGWDLMSQLPHLRIIPGKGLRYKHYYADFVNTKRLFSIHLSLLDPIYQRLLHTCADNHSEFLQKCDHPLWLNPEFYVQLPFKKNEDINPTKASHSGMNPDHLSQVLSECSELLSHQLIEPSSSQWACEAFYVNKRAEQNRGKLRLVINYQPLNLFLLDNKFPLPSRNSLFTSLTQAKVFSKFDLKAGFWQLGIHPDDRHKTGFCIPNQHYQWRVLPFGLKVAPSLFQKAMCQIFTPILHSAAIYIDDILLYSPDVDTHNRLLDHFSQIVQKFGIMLSQKKMAIAQTEIDFLGMHLKNGQYCPGPHIAAELLKFPDSNLSRKQVQQFLGIVNYLRDFVPHIAQMMTPLQQMLKKEPPQWTKAQTNAVVSLKEILNKSLPPLHIPGNGKPVLQTDASDEFWAAVLFEEIQGKRHLCGYKSGRFSQAEMHYHSTFKEILAVKYGIKKFEFHLIGHHFLIEMDMSSFPQMLKFKQKQIPHPQLLRWAEWFSKYSYTSVHIAGKKNVLADFLSRQPPPQEINMIISPRRTSIQPPKYFISRMHPHWPKYEYPPDLTDYIQQDSLERNFDTIIWDHHHLLFRMHGGSWLYPSGLNRQYPFIHPIIWKEGEFPDLLKWLLWYLSAKYVIAIEFPTQKILRLITRLSSTPHCLDRHEQNLASFLEWFIPLNHWTNLIRNSTQGITDDPERHTVLLFHKEWTFVGPQGQFLSGPASRGTTHYKPQLLRTIAQVYKTSPGTISSVEYNYHELQRTLFQENKVIPIEAWDHFNPVSWNHEPTSEQVVEDLNYYHLTNTPSSTQDMDIQLASSSDPWGGPLAQDPNNDIPSSSSLRDISQWPQPRIPSPVQEVENDSSPERQIQAENAFIESNFANSSDDSDYNNDSSWR